MLFWVDLVRKRGQERPRWQARLDRGLLAEVRVTEVYCSERGRHVLSARLHNPDSGALLPDAPVLDDVRLLKMCRSFIVLLGTEMLPNEMGDGVAQFGQTWILHAAEPPPGAALPPSGAPPGST
jgi:hypothetical protein